MNIILMQADLVWNDPQANREHFEQKIAQVADADLIVLPEMFSTGFCTSPRACRRSYVPLDAAGGWGTGGGALRECGY